MNVGDMVQACTEMMRQMVGRAGGLMGGGMMGGGMGMMPMFWWSSLATTVLLVLLVVGIVVVVRLQARSPEALQVLRLRYAKGELSRDEFEEARQLLHG